MLTQVPQPRAEGRLRPCRPARILIHRRTSRVRPGPGGGNRAGPFTANRTQTHRPSRPGTAQHGQTGVRYPRRGGGRTLRQSDSGRPGQAAGRLSRVPGGCCSGAGRLKEVSGSSWATVCRWSGLAPRARVIRSNVRTVVAPRAFSRRTTEVRWIPERSASSFCVQPGKAAVSAHSPARGAQIGGRGGSPCGAGVAEPLAVRAWTEVARRGFGGDLGGCGVRRLGDR